MKSIHATLSATQKTGQGRPIARASLADNGRLHPAVQFSDTYTGGRTFGVSCGTFYIRLRYKGSGVDTLEVQKVTTPTTESQWETWSAFASDVRAGEATGLFWTGTYVVAVWQDASDLHTYYRRSTDGTTWSSATLAHNFISPNDAYLSGVSGGISNSGIVLAYDTALYWAPYNPSADTWGSPEDAGITVDTDIAFEVAGLYNSTTSRHVFFLTPRQYLSWSRFALLVLARTGVSTFTTPRPYFVANGSNFKYISVSQSTINSFWWLSFARSRGWAVDGFWIAASDDGEFFEDPYPIDLLGEPLLSVMPALSGYTDPILADEREVHSSTAHTFSGWSYATVVRYTLTAAGELTVLLDNRSGALTAPQINSVLTLERGYWVEGTDYYQSAGVFYVLGYRYLARDQLLEVTAVNARGLLAAWHADQAFVWKGEEVQTLVEAIAALAGIHSISFQANTRWAETLSTFTIPAGMNGLAAFASLAGYAPFEYTVKEDGSLDAYIVGTGPASAATYGNSSGEHQLWPGQFGAQAHINYTAIVGYPPDSVGNEDADLTAIAAAGRRWSEFRHDPRAVTSDDAFEIAYYRQLLAREGARQGSLTAPPSLALETGDVITVNQGAYPPAADWRVVAIAEYFNQQKKQPFYQQITVRGINP